MDIQATASSFYSSMPTINREKISATIQKINNLLVDFFSSKETLQLATWSTLLVAVPYAIGVSSFVGYFTYISIFAFCIAMGKATDSNAFASMKS